MKSHLLVSITLGSFLTDPNAILPNWGWLIIAVPVKLSKSPMFVIVNVPSLTSSGFKSFDLAFEIKLFADLQIPTKLSWSAFLITGTIKFPFPKAVAIPIFILFLIIRLF